MNDKNIVCTLEDFNRYKCDKSNITYERRKPEFRHKYFKQF